jgi:hypothetical protein
MLMMLRGMTVVNRDLYPSKNIMATKEAMTTTVMIMMMMMGLKMEVMIG